MISIDKLQSYLTKHQSDDVDTVKKDLIFRIPEAKMSDGHIYGKYVMDGKFAFLGKELLPVPSWTELDSSYQQLVDKTSFKKNSFVIAILNQVMPEFRYFDGKSRISFARDLMRQISYDMEEKHLYREMEYTRMRNNIRTHFMNFDDIDGDEVMRRVIVDYFSLTVYIFRRDSEKKFGCQRLIEKVAFVPGIWKKTEREAEYSIKNPTCFLVEVEGRYNSIIKSELNGIFTWQDEGMMKLFNEFTEESKKSVVKKKPVKEVDEEVKVTKKKLVKLEPKEEEPKEEPKEESKEESKEEVKEDTEESVGKKGIHIPKKITLVEIQAMAEKEGISLTKKSDKTGKDLKKTILELRDEILKKYE